MYRIGVFVGVLLAAWSFSVAEVSIENLRVSAVKTDSVAIRWDSPTAAACQIQYGTDATYGLTSSEGPMNFFHATRLVGLKPGTTYHYRIKATEYGGAETVSPDKTFTTRTQAELEAAIRAAREDKGLPKTYYVKTDGNDAGNGLTMETAWQRPSFAAAKADVGDTIFLLDGTWNDEHVVFKRSGIDVAPITLAAGKDAKPTLYCTAPKANRDIGIRISGKSYINVEE